MASALEPKIDDLYRQPLSEFTGARNALAKVLSGDEAKRVKALAKPAIVPWAVNQVYWRARPTYERVMTSGEKLRTAQIAALEGKPADVRGAGEAHRRAIAEAVAEAERQAAAAGSKPAPDGLMRTFEALSLASAPPEAPGRLTEPLQPAGFEALAGVKPQQIGDPARVARHPARGPGDPLADGARSAKAANHVASRHPERVAPHKTKRDEKADRARRDADARAAAEARQREAAVRTAEAQLARVEAAEQQARAAWERAHDELLRARQAVGDLKRNPARTS